MLYLESTDDLKNKKKLCKIYCQILEIVSCITYKNVTAMAYNK